MGPSEKELLQKLPVLLTQRLMAFSLEFPAGSCTSMPATSQPPPERWESHAHFRDVSLLFPEYALMAPAPSLPGLTP